MLLVPYFPLFLRLFDSILPAKKNSFIYSIKNAIDELHQSFLRQAAQETQLINQQGTAHLQDPYTTIDKIRFEEAYRAHPIVRVAVHRRADFVFGKRMKTIIDLANDYFTDKEAKRNALEMVTSKQEFIVAKRKIDDVHRKINFQQKSKHCFIQMLVFGRSAALIGKNFESLEVLSSRLLGNVTVDEKTGELTGVQYSVNEQGLFTQKKVFPIEELIYWTNNDNRVSPLTNYYGFSTIEGIAHIAETDRMLNEQDFKETAARQWAPLYLLKFPTSKLESEIRNFVQNFLPGRVNAISQDISTEVLETGSNIPSLIELRNEDSKEIAACMSVPGFLVTGMEDVTNRATAEEVLLAWKESVLEQDRMVIKDIVQPQWLDRLFSVFVLNTEEKDHDAIEKGLKQAQFEREKATQELEKEVKDQKEDERKRKESITEIETSLLGDKQEPEAKITLEFEDITFETLESKWKVYGPLYHDGILPLETLLEKLGLDELLDQIKEIELKRQQQFQQQIELQQSRFRGKEPHTLQKEQQQKAGVKPNPQLNPKNEMPNKKFKPPATR